MTSPEERARLRGLMPAELEPEDVDTLLDEVDRLTDALATAANVTTYWKQRAERAEADLAGALREPEELRGVIAESNALRESWREIAARAGADLADEKRRHAELPDPDDVAEYLFSRGFTHYSRYTVARWVVDYLRALLSDTADD